MIAGHMEILAEVGQVTPKQGFLANISVACFLEFWIQPCPIVLLFKAVSWWQVCNETVVGFFENPNLSTEFGEQGLVFDLFV